MNKGAYIFNARMLACLSAWGVLAPAGAAQLTTLQNSPLSVPAAAIASNGVPGAANLTGSNFMLSVVSPVSANGGSVSLINSQQWVNYYPDVFGSYENSGYAIATRTDGSVVVTGTSAGSGLSSDFITLCYAPDGTRLWTNHYDGPAHGTDTARLLATTGAGDVWVAGDSMRFATNSGLTDVAVLRYAGNGSPLWTNRLTSTTNGVYPLAMVVDGTSNLYVESQMVYWSSNHTGSPVEIDLTKFDPQGNVVWTGQYPLNTQGVNQGLLEPVTLAVDNGGSVFLAGQAFDGGLSLVKYAGDGTPSWTNHHSYQDLSLVRSLLTDSGGNIIMTGEVFSHGASNYVNYVVMKCSKDGVSLWTNILKGPHYDGGNVPETLLDPTGNIFVIGGGFGSLPGFYQLLKCDSNGVPLWTNLNVVLGGTGGTIDGSGTDSAGNVYVIGGSGSQIIMKSSDTGAPGWSNNFVGPGGAAMYLSGLAVDATGSAYVTGQVTDYGQALVVEKYADQLVYAPPRDFTGSDTLSYTVVDNFGNHANGSITVVVTPGAFRFNISPTATTMTSNGMQLQLSGVPDGNAVVIDASTDLANWMPILTNTPAGGLVQFQDAAATTLSRRYYRAHQPQ